MCKYISRKYKNRIRYSLLAVQGLLIVSTASFSFLHLSLIKISVPLETSFQNDMFRYFEGILQT